MAYDAADWLHHYADVLQWSHHDVLQMVSKYFTVTDQTDKLRGFLEYETGVKLEPEDDDHAYKGQPFVVFAYGPAAEHYELEEFERVDAATELEALQAFTRLAGEEKWLDVVLSRFDGQGKRSLEIMRYHRGADPAITTRERQDYDYPEAFLAKREI